MERRIEEIFELIDGVKVEVVEVSFGVCDNCYLLDNSNFRLCNKMKCTMNERSDRTDVIFKKVKQ